MSPFFRLVLVLTLLACASCRKKSETPAVETGAVPPPAAESAPARGTPAPAQPTAPAPAPAPAATPAPVVAQPAGELPVLALARAYLGTEAVLNGIHSIHHYGTLVTNDPNDETKQTRATIEMVVVKPYKHKVTIASDATVEMTGLDNYDAWTRVTSVSDPTKWRQTLLGPEEIRRLRANTWENAAFFRGLEQAGGRVEDKGTATIDGVSCQKVAFVHAQNIVFTRYFDIATGRVVLTETEAGTTREQGEMRVDGLRVPKTLVTVYRNPAGGPARTVTITFEKVVLNETFPADYFAVPSLRVR